jgi:pimeloyl-ACP methyl ester carboxylesterase
VKTWWEPGGEQHLGALAARVLGSGPPIVLLHGLVGSSRYWGGAYDRLATDHMLIVPDLLGFGRSPRPHVSYGPDDHVAALLACLDEVGANDAALVGAHSAGATVALRLAATYPQRVRAVVGFGPPLYRSPADSRARLASMGPMARLFALPGRSAAVACAWVCNHRELAAKLAVLTHPRLPAPVAADSVQHTWTSYSETLQKLVLAAEAPSWLPDIRCRVWLVAGDADRVVDHEFLAELADQHAHVTAETWPGDHHLPLRQPERCSTLLERAAVTHPSHA